MIIDYKFFMILLNMLLLLLYFFFMPLVDAQCLGHTPDCVQTDVQVEDDVVVLSGEDPLKERPDLIRGDGGQDDQRIILDGEAVLHQAGHGREDEGVGGDGAAVQRATDFQIVGRSSGIFVLHLPEKVVGVPKFQTSRHDRNSIINKETDLKEFVLNRQDGPDFARFRCQIRD